MANYTSTWIDLNKEKVALWFTETPEEVSQILTEHIDTALYDILDFADVLRVTKKYLPMESIKKLLEWCDSATTNRGLSGFDAGVLLKKHLKNAV